LKSKTTKFISGIILTMVMVLALVVPLAVPMPASAAALTAVTNTPASYAAGATTTHTIAFTTITDLPKLGQMRFAFPPGFNVSLATADVTEGPDGTFTVTKSGQVIIVSRNGDGAVFGGGDVTVELGSIGNHQTAADYAVDVDTTDAFGVRLDGSTPTDDFTIVPAALAALVTVQQPTTTVAGVAIAPAVTVRAQDAFGNTRAGDAIAVTAVGFVFASGTTPQNTDASGIATFNDLITNTAGTGYQLHFANGGIIVDSNAFNVVAAALDELRITNEPTQTIAGVAIHSAVPGPVTVIAEDVFNNPKAGVAVDVTEVGHTYTFDAGTLQQTTNASGIATFGNLKINTANTGYQLHFASGGKTDDSALFDVVAAGLDTLTMQNQPRGEIKAGVAIDAVTFAPVTVEAKDEFDNVIAGVDVNVALNQNAFFSGTEQQTTNASGIASFGDLVITTADTGYVLSFSDDDTGLITEDSDAFNVVPDALATLTIQVQPTQTVAGDAISPAVTVLAQDQFGNSRAGDDIVVAENTGRDGNLAGTKTRTTAGNGIATFNNLVIDTAGTDYQLRFTSGAVPAEDSDLFDVVALEALEVIDQPTQTIAGQVIQGTSPVTVKALDTLGAPIAGIVVDVTLNKNAFASGTTTRTTGVDGIAEFDNLIINTAATDYQLHFASGGKTDDSALFDVTPAVVDTLTMVQQPTDALAGATIAPPVTVRAEDEFNNLIGGLPIDVTLEVGTGTLSGTTTQVTDGTGIATFDDLSIDMPGCKQLRFSGSAFILSDEFDVGTLSVELDAGWNLMSLPLIPNDTDIEVVLACIEDDVDSVWYYDPTIEDPDARWLIYSPPAFDSLEYIEDGKAYWINMDDAATLWIDGRELPAPPGLPPVYDVVTGWNMVGFKSTADVSAVDYLNAMDGKYTRIYGFESGAWFPIPPPAYAAPQMKPGLGYWVSFTEDGAIYP
jgi:hypothetical protein